jgi:OPA family sugar phosphate sensor protein UhpC-like MFS transporter
MLYLKEVKGYSNFMAGTCVCCFELGGVLGSLAAGWGSDILFKGRRMPVNVLFTCGILVALVGFRMMTGYAPILDGIYLFLFGFLIFGPQMLIGLACAELSHKKAAATATGFSGCFSYLGAAAAGGPLGALMNTWGWDSFFVSMISCAAIAMLCMAPLWAVKTVLREAKT